MDSQTLNQSPIVDLRSSEQYQRSHIVDSSNFPAEEIADRLHELPMRNRPIRLLGSEQQIACTRQFLQQKNYTISSEIVITEQKILQLKEKGLIESGRDSKRLWQPAKVIKQFAQLHKNQHETRGVNSDCQKQTEVPNMKALDLACGSGRDSVYLSTMGWQMTSVDYSASSLEKTSLLAERLGQNIETINWDIEKRLDELIALNWRFDALVIIRYLHRPLLQKLQQMINKQGFIVYQTFLKGCEKFGSPKNPRFLLQPGELASTFSDFKIHLDEVEYLEDGRPTNRFIAQKIR